MSPLFGWDASDYDWGRGPVDVDAARKAGISLFTHKISEGKSGWFRALHAGEALKRAAAAGVPVIGGYHVLHPADMGPIADQADWYLKCLDDAWGGWRQHPCFIHQIDAEKFDYMSRAPSLAEIHGFAGLIVAKTGCAPSQVVVYAPEWLYGGRLHGLQYPLWASNYGRNLATDFRRAYPGDNTAGWVPYSGIAPLILQYGSKAVIGSQHTCDANAIRVSSEDELVALFTGDTMPTAQDVVDELLRPKNVKALGEALQPFVRTTVIDRDKTTLAQGIRQLLAGQDATKLAKALKAAGVGGGAVDDDQLERVLRKLFADAGDPS